MAAMSDAQKESMSLAMTLIFRIMTGLSAFFLIQTYALVSKTNEMIQSHLLRYEKDHTEIEVRLRTIERDEERERERDRTSNNNKVWYPKPSKQTNEHED